MRPSPYQNRSILYVLPCPGFFSQCGSVGGHVTNALSVIRTLSSFGYGIIAVAAESVPELDPFDLVIVPGASGSLIARLRWNVAVLLRLRRLLSARKDLSFVYVRYAAAFAPFIPVLRLLTDKPIVLEVNSLGSDHMHAWYVWDLAALRSVHAIRSVSEGTTDRIRRFLPEREHAKVLTIPNGVDAGRFTCGEEPVPRATSHEVRIGYAGVIKRGYALEGLIQAFAQVRERHPAATLTIYGEGPYRTELTRQYSNADGLVIAGPVPGDRMPGLLSRLDILVNPTPRSVADGSVKLYEYMAAGKPLVHAYSPAVEKVLEGDTCGLMFESGNATDLAAKINYLIEHPDRAHTMAIAAAREVRAKHTWKIRITDMLNGFHREELLF